MAETSKIAQGVRRGLALRCPSCGEGRLFRGYLKIADHCEECGADNTRYPSDDAPPYLTILLVGHLLLPVIMWMDGAWAFGTWAVFALWLPVMGIATLVLLPFVKAAVVGFAWATGVTRETSRQ